MATLVVGLEKASALSWSSGIQITHNPTNLYSKSSLFPNSRRLCRLYIVERISGLSFDLNKGFKIFRGINSKIPVNDRDEVRFSARAWKTDDDGAGSSGNASQLRRFLRGYEGWQGEKAPRRINRISSKKKKKRREEILVMLKALEDIANIDEALEPWKGRLKENEQGMLLNDQWRCDRALELFKWFHEQDGYVPNTCHYTIMLKKCGRAQKWDLVRSLLSEMELKNVKLNCYTYNTLIDVYEKAGRQAEATLWFERSRKEGFVDEVAIGSQINVLKEFGNFEEGNRLYDSLPHILAQASGVQIQAKDDPVSMVGLNESDGNDGTVGAADSAADHLESSSQGETHLGKARQHPVTSEVVDGLELPVYAKKVDTYNIMMDLHGKAGDFEKASMTFRDMVKAGIEPDIVTYNTMIHICGRAGRIREAKALFKKISEKDLVPDVASYNTLISMFLGRGEKLKALHYYQRMKSAGIAPNAITFHILLRYSMISVADIGSSVELGKHITSLMEELSLGVGEPMQDSELAQTIMLNLYKKAGMKELALSAAKRMREAGLSTNLVSFNSVLEMSQSLSEAKDIFGSMQRKQIMPDVSSYNRMAGVLKRVGLYYEALQEIEDADSAGLPLNLHILTTAVSLYSHVGMHEEALEACGAMRKCGFPLDAAAYNAMMYAFGNAGRVDEAVRISMEMQDKEVKADVVTHTTVITVYAKMGLIEGVSRVYKRMKKAQCEPDEITYKQLISIYKDAGREDLAAMVFQERQFARYLARQYTDDPTADFFSTDTIEEEQVAEVESAES